MTRTRFSRRYAALVCAALLLPLVSAPSPAAAQVEPSVVNTSWELDFDYVHPKAIAVKGMDGKLKWYWYITYTVTNNSGEEQVFFPEFTIAYDNGEVFTANTKVPIRVFDLIKETERLDLLDRPTQVVGKLLQGDDFARESVAVWPASKGDVDEVTIFVAGFTGDSVKYTNPDTGKDVILRRNLEIRYATPGTGNSPQAQSLKLLGQRDVMR